MKILIKLTLLSAFLLSSCSYGEQGEKGMKKNDLFEITKRYVIQEFPQSEGDLDLPMIIIEHEEYWEVTFKLPELTLGGVPVVHISKATKAVIKGYHTQ